VFSIEYERCETPPGGEASCSTGELTIPDSVPATQACAVGFAPKFGVDPSQYLPGLNVYTFTLRLRSETCVVSEHAYTVNLTYTPTTP
jgi:hypothetical protein